MIIKCKECGTKLDIDEVDYECGVPSSTICPLCGVEVSFTIPKPEVKSRKPKASYKTHLEEKESPTSCDFVYCPECGQMVSKKDEKCPNCGFPAKLFHNQSKHQVKTANEVSTQQATIFNEPRQIQQPQRKNPLGLIVAILILSLVVIGLLIAFLVTKCSQDSINETTQTEIQQSGLEEGNNQPSYSDYETRYDYVCERYVRDSDLIGLSKEELRIMRNWIFARHGYIFKSEDLQEYFGRFSWYYPRYTDVTNMLSDIEITNIDFIKRYE